jgi:hypothetical protein
VTTDAVVPDPGASVLGLTLAGVAGHQRNQQTKRPTWTWPATGWRRPPHQQRVDEIRRVMPMAAVAADHAANSAAGSSMISGMTMASASARGMTSR